MAGISIVIPVYNTSRYLKQCLDSVVGQTLQDIEIICVNDGSTDNSLAILKDYAQRDSRITVISQANGGLSVARNAGLKVVKSPYFQFLDSDDLLHPQTLEVLHSIITKQRVDFVQCGYTKVQENFRLEHPVAIDVLPYYQLSHNVLDDFFKERKNRHVMVWLRMHKTDAFRDITFPVNVCPMEDTVYTMRTLYSAKSAAFTQEPLIYYRQHSSSIMASKVSQKYIDSHLSAGEILYQDLSCYEDLTDNQKSFLQKFIMRKLFHPVRKVMRKMPDGLDKENTLADLKQKLLELQRREVFVSSDLPLLNRLAANSFLQGSSLLAKALLQ